MSGSTSTATAGASLGLPDRLRPIRRVGSGGMAAVWCATDTLLDRRVAIKLPGGSLADDPGAAARFAREARTAARLSGHRHIVSIFDVGTTDHGVPYIVMEYLPGGTVADALRTGSVTPELALRWVAETSAALDHAHHEGVVHRDVKPANLLLDREAGSVHVADFGIARASSEETITSAGGLLGTAAYLAPEQALGERATPASDRYALAVLTYELLTGRRPFIGENIAAQTHQRLATRPPAPSRVNRRLPGQVDRVLARGLAREPAARWTTAAAFSEALSEAFGMELLAASPSEPPTERLAPEVPRGHAPRRVAPVVAAREAVHPPRNPLFAGPRRRETRPAARAAAVGALAAVVAVGVALASGTGSNTQTRAAASGRTTTDASVLPAPAPARPARHRPPPASTTRSSTQTATATSSPSATASTRPGPASPTGLEATGHALMTNGQYSTAIAVLQRAVRAASPASVTYAYALYDLGRSLRLSGDPAAAIPVLVRRLQIPNQTGVVRSELVMAVRAAGARITGGAAVPHGRHGHGRHGDGSGPSRD